MGLAICASLVALLIPWALHMGQRLTPLYFSGTGMLETSGGIYPMYVLIYPTMQRANGLQGWASLCTSQNVITPLDVNGVFSNGWWSLDHASTEIALLETQGARDTLLDPNKRSAVDLFGAWHGPELVLENRSESSGGFLPGLNIEHASVRLKWGSRSKFKTACANMPGRNTYYPKSK